MTEELRVKLSSKLVEEFKMLCRLWHTTPDDELAILLRRLVNQHRDVLENLKGTVKND